MVAVLHEKAKMMTEMAILCEWKWSTKSIFAARRLSESKCARKLWNVSVAFVHSGCPAVCSPPAVCVKKKVETDDTWNKKRTLASIRAQSHSLKVVEQSAWMRKCSQCVKNEQNSISKHLELRRYSHSSTPGPSRLWWVDENRTFSVFRTL